MVSLGLLAFGDGWHFRSQTFADVSRSIKPLGSGWHLKVFGYLRRFSGTAPAFLRTIEQITHLLVADRIAGFLAHHLAGTLDGGILDESDRHQHFRQPGV